MAAAVEVESEVVEAEEAIGHHDIPDRAFRMSRSKMRTLSASTMSSTSFLKVKRGNNSGKRFEENCPTLSDSAVAKG